MKRENHFCYLETHILLHSLFQFFKKKIKIKSCHLGTSIVKKVIAQVEAPHEKLMFIIFNLKEERTIYHLLRKIH